MALQSMPIEYIWAWLDGAKHRMEETRWFRGELLSAVLRASNIIVTPEQIYPTRTKNLDEQLVELEKKWSTQ